MTILVTGGAGFIGSHTVVELQNAGYDVVVLDNLSNASEAALERVEAITGKPVKFYKADIRDREALEEIFTRESIDCCIHFAGLKAVGESVQKPWEYYENNISGTLILVDVMVVFNPFLSSSKSSILDLSCDISASFLEFSSSNRWMFFCWVSWLLDCFFSWVSRVLFLDVISSFCVFRDLFSSSKSEMCSWISSIS